MKVKNWTKFQHYAHRNPPWIKLHRELLDEPDWFNLSGDQAKFLVEVWLIASSNKEGMLPDIKKLAFRTRRTEKEVESLINKLSSFLVDDASMLQDRGETEKRESRDKVEKSKEEGEYHAFNSIPF
jgi:hypothetical protein